MPLTQRVPKRGFKNPFRKEVEIVNVGELARLGDGATVDAESLVKSGLVRGSGAAIKLLGEGESPKNLTIKLNRVSAGARTKVEAAGGNVELLA
jgi:large subunit ribosomal protein L15